MPTVIQIAHFLKKFRWPVGVHFISVYNFTRIRCAENRTPQIQFREYDGVLLHSQASKQGLKYLLSINNLRNSAIQSKEIIFILRMWQHGSLSEHNDSKSWRIDSKLWGHERQVHFLLNAKQAHVLHRAHKRLSNYAMIVIPGQIKILSQG